MSKRWLWLLLPIGIACAAGSWAFSNFAPSNTIEIRPTATPAPLRVVSSCPSPSAWPQIDYLRLDKALTINASTLDGRPLVGLCIVALLDNMPFEPIQYVGTCITGNQGQCSFQVPANLVRLYFGESEIDGLPLANSLNDITSYAGPAQDSIVYIIGDDDTAAISYLVATPRRVQGEMVLKIAHRTENGLQIIRPDIPDWTSTIIEATPTKSGVENAGH